MTVNLIVSRSLQKAQIASLLCSKQDVIETHIMDVELQVCIITVQNRSFFVL